MGRLARIVRHDLRSPIAILLGQIELLRMRGDLTERDAASVDSLERAAQQLLELVDEAGALVDESGR